MVFVSFSQKLYKTYIWTSPFKPSRPHQPKFPAIAQGRETRISLSFFLNSMANLCLNPLRVQYFSLEMKGEANCSLRPLFGPYLKL